jgi:hypothetical protein
MKKITFLVLVLTLICWENVFLKGRHGRLNPQNPKYEEKRPSSF